MIKILQLCLLLMPINLSSENLDGCDFFLEDWEKAPASGYKYYRLNEEYPAESREYRKVMKHIESELQSDDGSYCVRFIDYDKSPNKNKEPVMFNLEEVGRFDSRRDQILMSLGIGRLYKRDCDLEDGSGKLTVKEVVEISLDLNCPVKTKTVLKYAELMARQCESHTKERKTVKGAKGVPGFPGRPGVPGLKGYGGLKGLPGFSGRPGLPGMNGKPGAAGEGQKGDKGMPGEPGPREGQKGDQGYDGFEGQPGDKGFPGMPGLKGIKGEEGDHTRMALPGFPGYKGGPGIPGQRGELGNNGFDGPPGYPGERGECAAYCPAN